MRFFRACLLAVTVAAGTASAIWGLNQYLIEHPPTDNFELENRAARALVDQHPIVFPSRINEPMLRWSMAEQLEKVPELILLGSSHGLQVSSENFRRHRLLNLSISGAMLADHLISTEILTRRAKRPRVWLVMVDAWLFDHDVDFVTWHAHPQEILRMENTLSKLEDPPLPDVFGPRVERFLSASKTAKYSLDPLLKQVDRVGCRYFDHVVIPDRDFQATLMAPDGSLQPSSDKQQITPAEVRSLALRQFAYSGDRHRYGNYPKVDEDLWRLFERWIQFLQKDGGRVYFILSPYHPAIYKQIVANPQNQLRTIENRLWETSLRLSVPVIGSYNPEIVEVSDDDFYDGDHLRETGLTRLLDPALPEITYGL